jgi:hypothetical protein
MLLLLVGTAQAALLSRLGGESVYDTVRNITWLADANAGAGSIYDTGSSATDGRMNWANANAWAASLTFGGHSDWRLPTTWEPDPTCSGRPDSDGLGCRLSEMGHLFYTELGGTALESILTSDDPDLALFRNINELGSWSSTEFGPNPVRAYFFEFVAGGRQESTSKIAYLHAWAVAEGDVFASSIVPIPAAVWLFGSGLGALGWFRRRKTA